jgi:hypothetical protein
VTFLGVQLTTSLDELEAARRAVQLAGCYRPRGRKPGHRSYATEAEFRERLHEVRAELLCQDAPLNWQTVSSGLGLSKSTMYEYLNRYGMTMADIVEGRL